MINTMPRRVLLVDDDRSVLNAITRGLPQYQWDTAQSGREALKRLEHQEYELMITDVRMPDGNGIELLNKLSSLEKKGGVNPFMGKIILTGYSDENSLDHCLKAPGVYRVGKPWDDDLEVTIRRAIENVNLKKMLQSYKDLMTCLAHEINTPLLLIQGFSSLGLNNLSSQQSVANQRYYEEIQKAANHLAALINRIPKYPLSQVESAPMAKKRHDLMDCTNSVIQLMRPLSKKKDIKITVVPSNISTECYFDPTMMQQVLINLFNNAIKYSPKDSEIMVTFDYDVIKSQDGKTLPSGLKMNLSDRGRGIPEDELQSVFKKFIRSSNTINDPENEQRSLGLGLAICKEIISKHEGQIWAENRHGGGTVMHIVLPR